MKRALIAAAISLALALPAAAQNAPPAAPALSVEYYDGVIAQLNRAASALYAENAALRAELKRLEAKAAGLQAELDKRKAEASPKDTGGETADQR